MKFFRYLSLSIISLHILIFLFVSIKYPETFVYIPSINMTADVSGPINCTNCLFIRSDALGNGSGSDWTNAYPSFANINWQRDYTYYVASGNYSGDVVISKNLDGNKWIIIKKADESDYGVSTGWDSSYGSGQVKISGSLSLSSGYIEVDGVVGSGMSNHGIIIHSLNKKTMGVVNLDGSTGPYSLSHLDVQGPGFVEDCSGTSGGTDGIYNNNGAYQKNLHISDSWIHEVSRNGITVGNLVGSSYSDYGLLFENNVISHTGGCGEEYDVHSQGFQLGYQSSQSYIIIRNNLFTDIIGTGDIAALGTASTNRNILIYNNLFTTSDKNTYYSAPAVVYFREGAGNEVSNVGVYNNIFYNLGMQAPGAYKYGGILNEAPIGSNLISANNIWSDSYLPYTGPAGNGFISNNNDYYNNVGSGVPAPGGTNQFETASPFVNAASGDFNLVSSAKAINNGVNLSGTVDSDFDGLARPQGSAWDIGAYEYKGAATPPITPPTDTTPAVISLFYPVNSLPDGTKEITLSLSTDESATCKYSKVANTSYTSMTTFTTTGARAHTTTITGLSDGSVTPVYTKCQDVALNINPTDFHTNISVLSPVLTDPACILDSPAWSICVNSSQSRTLNATNQPCTGLTTKTETQGCTVTPPSPTICTSFTYSKWGACTNDTNTRTITSSSPNGCTGGTPVTTQSCSVKTKGGGGGGGGGSKPTSTITPTTAASQTAATTTTVSAPTLTICQFINLLIAIDVVPMIKASVVKQVFGC